MKEEVSDACGNHFKRTSALGRPTGKVNQSAEGLISLMKAPHDLPDVLEPKLIGPRADQAPAHQHHGPEHDPDKHRQGRKAILLLNPPEGTGDSEGEVSRGSHTARGGKTH